MLTVVLDSPKWKWKLWGDMGRYKTPAPRSLLKPLRSREARLSAQPTPCCPCGTFPLNTDILWQNRNDLCFRSECLWPWVGPHSFLQMLLRTLNKQLTLTVKASYLTVSTGRHEDPLASEGSEATLSYSCHLKPELSCWHPWGRGAGETSGCCLCICNQATLQGKKGYFPQGCAPPGTVPRASSPLQMQHSDIHNHLSPSVLQKMWRTVWTVLRKRRTRSDLRFEKIL